MSVLTLEEFLQFGFVNVVGEVAYKQLLGVGVHLVHAAVRVVVLAHTRPGEKSRIINSKQSAFLKDIFWTIDYITYLSQR